MIYTYVQQTLTGLPLSHVLVTGATGYIGAHIVDLLLKRGIKVTGTARSQSKANQMKTAREQYGDLFSMVVTGDLTAPGTFDDAAQDVDVIIHVASVSLFSYHESLGVLVTDPGFLAHP